VRGYTHKFYINEPEKLFRYEYEWLDIHTNVLFFNPSRDLKLPTDWPGMLEIHFNNHFDWCQRAPTTTSHPLAARQFLT